ncbi:hypothetical protein AGMMS49992_29790 [Clostridia bacterium]|nr:hypothetical protein AGMMS49992_29790 [Clostridia bacterium]
MRAMPWIKLETSAYRHRKKYALADALGVSAMAAFGCMSQLWSWAAECCQDGNLNAFPPYVIARNCDYDGDPNDLIRALKSVGLVDENGYIHDWDDHVGGDIIKLKAKDDNGAERSLRKRINIVRRSLGLPPIVPGDPLVYPEGTPQAERATRKVTRDDTRVATHKNKIENKSKIETVSPRNPVTPANVVPPVTPAAAALEDPVVINAPAPARETNEELVVTVDPVRKIFRDNIAAALVEPLGAANAEPAADMLLDAADTDDQAVNIVEIVRHRAKNSAMRGEIITNPLNYLTGVINKSKARGLKTNADFVRDTIEFSNGYEYDTG